MLAELQAETSVLDTRQSFALAVCSINLNPKQQRWLTAVQADKAVFQNRTAHSQTVSNNFKY